MPAIIGALFALLGKIFGDNLLRWIATKALIITLMVTVLPIVLKNVIVWMFSTIMNIASSYLPQDAELESFTITLTGPGAYLAQQLQLPLCISILLTAYAVRIVLNMIPMVR
jgi:hypothetical protein